MVYFPETGTPATAATTTAAAIVTERIDSETRKVSGLPLAPVASDLCGGRVGTAGRPCAS